MRRIVLDSRGRSSAGAAFALLLLIVVILGVWWLMAQRPFAVDEAVEKVGEETGDAAVTARVKTALALSKRVPALDIDVDTERGIVTLSGEVASEEARLAAEEIARDTTGVVGVENRLYVNGSPPGARSEPETDAGRDRSLEDQVNRELARDETVREMVTVEVNDGVVILRGEVDTLSQKQRAEALAGAAPGVEALTSRIEVVSESLPEAEPKTSLSARVEAAIRSTDVFRMDWIRVEAEGEAVRLTGRVPSEAERQLAGKLAEDVEGVARVINELEVTPSRS